MVRGMAEFGTDLRRYILVRTELGLFAALLSLALLFSLGVPLPVAQQDLENIRIDGLIPQILSIQPVRALPVLSELAASGSPAV